MGIGQDLQNRINEVAHPLSYHRVVKKNDLPVDGLGEVEIEGKLIETLPVDEAATGEFGYYNFSILNRDELNRDSEAQAQEIAWITTTQVFPKPEDVEFTSPQAFSEELEKAIAENVLILRADAPKTLHLGFVAVRRTGTKWCHIHLKHLKGV